MFATFPGQCKGLASAGGTLRIALHFHSNQTGFPHMDQPYDILSFKRTNVNGDNSGLTVQS